MSKDTTEVDTYLKFVAAVRIAYGVAAFAVPGLSMLLIGAKDNDDARIPNRYLGSRDIAIGVHSLVAIKTGTQRDAVLANQLCEVVDSVIIAGDVARNGKVTPISAFGITFNVSQHLAWIRSRMLLKG